MTTGLARLWLRRCSISSASVSPHSSDVWKDKLKVLDYCNASPKDYKCIFTSGATAALKLVEEVFTWTQQSNFVYTVENHRCTTLRSMKCTWLTKSPVFGDFLDKGNAHHNLFAFPSECNFSSSKFNLDLVNIMKKNLQESQEIPLATCMGCCMVLIDAAKGCVTQPPDLSQYPADFVAISFYKIFGYPTGLGALIIQNNASRLLKKTYFSGGTVAASIADIRRRQGTEEQFEDGTASFLSIESPRHWLYLQ